MAERNYKIKIRRGLAANRPTLSVGEQWLDTDTGNMWIGSSSGNLAVACPPMEFKRYAAKVSLNNTAAPSPTVFVNTFGQTLNWTRTGAGAFTLTGAVSQFNSSRTYVRVTSAGNQYILIGANVGAQISVEIIGPDDGSPKDIVGSFWIEVIEAAI